MFFLFLLTIGFVYEFGKGALYFTDHRSSLSISTPTSSSDPLLRNGKERKTQTEGLIMERP